MKLFLFINIALSFLDLFIIIYTSTLHLYDEKLRQKWKQESLVGVTIIFLTLLCCFLWVFYFYFLIFD